MKFVLSAALVSLALSATLCAQSAPAPTGDVPPPPPGMHPEGGPHGRMPFGPGRASHHVEPIANAPFTAQFTETANRTDRDGKQQQRTSTSIVYRDSQGRVREEITLPAPPPRVPEPATSGTAPAAPSTPRVPRTVVTILDPVAHTITHLNAERQTAFVQTVPTDFFTRMQQRESRREAGPGPQDKRDNATTTSLGSKVIAGVSTTGEQRTLTLPARDGGATHTITSQRWFSPDLKLEISLSESSDRGTHTDTLTSLSRTEPDPSLFQVPAGYTMASAPDHHERGRHHGGPGGPGGPDGQDAPPPPPPSM